MKPFYLLIVIVLSPLLLIAQVKRTKNPRCGTIANLKLHFKQHPEFEKRFELERMRFNKIVKDAVSRKANRTNNFRTAATTIPVVFHIVTTNPNSVTDAQVQAQLDTLNKDFAGTNGDAVRVPSYFKPFFGSSGIQFCLAKRTPGGIPTTGIERITTNVTSFDPYDELMKHTTSGGADAWDPSSYYNIWLVNFGSDPNGTTLGYATLPDDEDVPPNEQGVVIDYNTLPGGPYVDYSSGKTLVHETGHYFNLYHTWGDNDPAEDNDECAGSDDIDDTPNQAVASEGCYNGIRTDNCTPTGNGIMYQNYMDYSSDRCLVMFTKDQVTRMESALLRYRASLMASNGCAQPNPNLVRLGFMVTPNPSNGIIVAQFYPIPKNLLGIDIYNAMGQKLLGPGLTTNNSPSSAYSFDITNYPAGTYFIRAIFSDRIVTRKIFKY